MAEDALTPPEESLPDLNVEVEDSGTLKKKVTVTVPREEIDKKFEEMYGELRESAQIPGFRIGRAPKRLIEKRFGNEVRQDVRNSLIGETLGRAIEDAELNTLSEPDLDLEAIDIPDEGDLTFSFEVEVAPEFDLPETEGIEVTRHVFEVDDEKIDEYLENIRQGQARYEKTDEPAAEGDSVVAAAKITGEEIDHDNPRVQIRVAPGVVEGIPLMDLPKELAGKTTDDAVTFKATVPESHPNEDWQGKEVTIELTVHEVHRRVLPELDETFAATAGFDNVDEMREFVALQLKQRVDQEIQQSMRQQICDHLLDKTDFDLPEGVTQRHTQRLLQRQMINLLSRGMPREKIEENLAEMQAEAEKQAKNDLKLSFILNKIADDRDVAVSEAEINTRVAQMAAQYGRRPERLRQELAADGTLQQVGVNIREEKVLDALLSEANVTEKDVDADEDSDKEQAPAKKSSKKASKKSDKKDDKAKDEADEEEKPSAKKASKKKSAKKKSAKKSDDE